MYLTLCSICTSLYMVYIPHSTLYRPCLIRYTLFLGRLIACEWVFVLSLTYASNFIINALLLMDVPGRGGVLCTSMH